MEKKVNVDVLIFGGGIAGLWTLNYLRDRNHSCILIENKKLGHGQSVTAQGIIHGGAKYALPNALRLDSSSEIRGMPDLWRKHLSGELKPDLSKVKINSDYLYMWFSKDHSLITSKLFDYGREVLTTVPEKVSLEDAPSFLGNSSSRIYKVREPVIDMPSLLKELAKKYSDNIIYSKSNFEVEFGEKNKINKIFLGDLIICPNHIILTSGNGNEELAKKMGIKETIMQKRPLRQIVLKGNLPEFYGHNIDGLKPSATITTNFHNGNTYWNIGGDISENFNGIDQARVTLSKILPSIDFSKVEISYFQIDRAEPINKGNRPGSYGIYQDRNVIVAWPTKLALAPILADKIFHMLENPKVMVQPYFESIVDVAECPWFTEDSYHHQS